MMPSKRWSTYCGRLGMFLASRAIILAFSNGLVASLPSSSSISIASDPLRALHLIGMAIPPFFFHSSCLCYRQVSGTSGRTSIMPLEACLQALPVALPRVRVTIGQGQSAPPFLLFSEHEKGGILTPHGAGIPPTKNKHKKGRLRPFSCVC